MVDNYVSGEERFGPVMSRLYNACTRLRAGRGLYLFAYRDLAHSGAAALLDVGCGPATIAIMLARRNKARVFCVDPSPYMVGIARRNAKGVGGIEVAEGSSRKVPFSRKFDIVYTSLSFHHWQGKAESLRYLKGLLARGGEIRIYEYTRTEALLPRLLGISAHTLDMDELRRAARRSGLRVRGVVRSGMAVRVSLG